MQTFGGAVLHLYDISGCGGLIKSGDALTFHARFSLQSPQGGPTETITSP